MGQEKSIYYKNLIPIFKLKNTSFIDLEYNNSEEDKKNIHQMTGKKIHRINEIDYYNNILGVSSIINACDLIITCSNVNAHISEPWVKKHFYYCLWEKEGLKLSSEIILVYGIHRLKFINKMNQKIGLLR